MANDPSTQAAVRADLAGAAGALLLGPLSQAEVIESAPADTYLTGILWPRGAPVDGVDDDTGLDSGSEPASGVETSVPGYRAIRPCSIGITFAVARQAVVTISLGETARYHQLEVEATAGSSPANGQVTQSSQAVVSQPAHPRKAWARQRLGYSVRIPYEEVSGATRINEFVDAQGASIVDRRLAVHVRRRAGIDQHVFTVTLINEEPDDEDSGPRDARCLFQAELVIRSDIDGAPAIQPRKAPLITSTDEDARTNALLYRDVREFAVGHGIAATWVQDAAKAVHEVRTAWLPETRVPGTSPDGHELLDSFRRAHPDALKAEFLGREHERDAITASLEAFAGCYAIWIEQFLRARLGEFDGDLEKAAQYNLVRCTDTLERIRAGVEMLRQDDAVWAAFALANTAMDRQSRFRAKEVPRPLRWRPFQLAFMLLVLPGLADPELDDRQCMDLLWFPRPILR
jgi:hypothetical protein